MPWPLTETIASPAGPARHFCEPVIAISTPHPSASTRSPPIDVMPSMMKSASCFRASLPTSCAGFLIPAEVSLCTSVTTCAPCSSRSSSAERLSGVPHSDAISCAFP